MGILIMVFFLKNVFVVTSQRSVSCQETTHPLDVTLQECYAAASLWLSARVVDL
jgi:hypothetical protein